MIIDQEIMADEEKYTLAWQKYPDHLKLMLLNLMNDEDRMKTDE